MIKYLINQHIPRYGLPRTVRSDNGSHFSSKDLAAVEKMLGIKHAYGCVYHPQSQGKVERMNRTLKEKLAKCCKETVLKWPEALPIVLMSLTASVNSSTGFSPHELLTGRVMISAEVPALSEEEQPKTSPGEYHESLTALVSSLSHQIQDRAEADSPEEPEDPIKEGEWVWLRVLKRRWTEPRWTGPHKVEAATSHSVRLVKKGSNWYHQTLCARASEPQGARPLDQVETDPRDVAATT